MFKISTCIMKIMWKVSSGITSTGKVWPTTKAPLTQPLISMASITTWCNMRVYICGYGVIHFSGKCNCWKREHNDPHPRYIMSEELAALPPGKYNVTSHPTDKPGQ